MDFRIRSLTRLKHKDAVSITQESPFLLRVCHMLAHKDAHLCSTGNSLSGVRHHSCRLPYDSIGVSRKSSFLVNLKLCLNNVLSTIKQHNCQLPHHRFAATACSQFPPCRIMSLQQPASEQQAWVLCAAYSRVPWLDRLSFQVAHPVIIMLRPFKSRMFSHADTYSMSTNALYLGNSPSHCDDAQLFV